jgi:hypothetical protein
VAVVLVATVVTAIVLVVAAVIGFVWVVVVAVVRVVEVAVVIEIETEIVELGLVFGAGFGLAVTVVVVHELPQSIVV